VIRVVYRKYDGALHWNHAAERLGEDEHGVWVGVRADTPTYKGEALWGPCEAPFVLLMPREHWWTAMFNAAPHRTEIYCDITTVPQWSGGGASGEPAEVSMIDLDLDVRRRRAGSVDLLDEDEFATHRVAFGYPAEVVAAAEAAASWLTTAVRERAEPFGAASAPWLARVT
jgi:protein associated with RNAse G/E